MEGVSQLTAAYVERWVSNCIPGSLFEIRTACVGLFRNIDETGISGYTVGIPSVPVRNRIMKSSPNRIFNGRLHGIYCGCGVRFVNQPRSRVKVMNVRWDNLLLLSNEGLQTEACLKLCCLLASSNINFPSTWNIKVLLTVRNVRISNVIGFTDPARMDK